ncbi:MAG: chemotaxis protein CheA [Bacteriovoracaceae bacterium]|nr:chemotaxis protein CheA [Bacteriovoracaceae bacterium]
MEDFELELKLDFLNESEDLLESAESAFLLLETQRNDMDLLNEIFRLAHNLKGTSKAVGFDQLAELTHVAENLILKLKDGTLDVDDSIVSILLQFKDKVNEMVEGLKEDLDRNFDIEELKVEIEKKVNGPQEICEQIEQEFVETDEQILDIPSGDDNRFEEFEDNSSQEDFIQGDMAPSISQAAIESLRESGFDEETIQQILEQSDDVQELPVEKSVEDIEESVPAVQSAPVEVKETEQKPVIKRSKTTKEVDESIRVKLSRIGQLNNVIGELVILQTIISQRRYAFIQDDLTNKSIGMMGKLFKEVQELAMSLRMLPLKSTFQKMTRIVRDTSRALGKDVNLHLVGEETEVDKTVLEKLADPLVHIVRNAVDHGLEMPGMRTASGKDAKGNVELFAYHEGSNLVIQVTDDGKGIDPSVIRAKAIEKGITQASTMKDDEVIQLIFHPGFSTKEQVTEVSGRGVGMDVVRTNIEALGGEVKLMSKVGEGSSLKIILPLTLAIIEGIVIKSQEDKFVLPLSQIFEISQVKANDIESFSGVAKLFKLRGEVLPLFHINSKIGKPLEENKDDYTVIIVRGLSHSFGVIVDDILNQQQIVIKKLGEDVRQSKGIIGSAIMADGMPSLILDLFELFKDDLKTSRAHQKYKNRSLSA